MALALAHTERDAWDEVEEWRVERFEEHGASQKLARRLARAGVDWHSFAVLVESGASPVLAALILL